MAEIEYGVEGGVGIIRLNRPHRRNAFTLSMIRRWAELVIGAQDDDEVRVVVLTGNGTSFCAGIDFEELARVEPVAHAHRALLTREIHRVARAVEQLDKPLIAAVNGAAMGAGLDMALMCDLRYVSSAATLAESYVDIGLVPGDGGAFYLPRIVGEARALELLWTGDPVDAGEAVRLGIATKVMEPDALMDEVLQIARHIAAKPPLAVQLTKATVRRSRNLDALASLDLVASHAAVVMSTDDHTRAVAAARARITDRHVHAEES